MRKIEENFINNWGKIREKGRNIYAFKTGILWSAFTACFTKIFELSYFSFKEVYLNLSFLKYFVLFVVIGALLFWKFIWVYNEKRYIKLLKDKENESNR